jgi:hypothetical protein
MRTKTERSLCLSLWAKISRSRTIGFAVLLVLAPLAAGYGILQFGSLFPTLQKNKSLQLRGLGVLSIALCLPILGP